MKPSRWWPSGKAWDQEVCSLCGLRFEPCGCSYDGHWRAYMIVNFRARGISRGARKLAPDTHVKLKKIKKMIPKDTKSQKKKKKHLTFRERSQQHPLRKREKGKKCGLIHTEAHLVPDQRETVEESRRTKSKKCRRDHESNKFIHEYVQYLKPIMQE